MIKLILHSALLLAGNTAALFIAMHVFEKFMFTGTITELFITGVILTAINIFLKPLLKLFFGPLILLSLGLFSLVINAMILAALDIASEPLTIEGYDTLLFAAVLISAVNVLTHLFWKWFRD